MRPCEGKAHTMTGQIIIRSLAIIIIGYLLGSIPFGLIIGRAAGVDVRSTGSGKTGATNVLRSAGIGPGLAAVVCDALKGAVPVLLAWHLFAPPSLFGAGHQWVAQLIEAAAGLAAVAGHNWPIYVGFRGGRGVAATGGMALALALPVALIALVFFIVPIVLTRYVSLGSIIGGLSLAVVDLVMVAAGWNLAGSYATFVALLIAGVAIVVAHHDNIQRLLSGTERKLGEKATPTPAQ